MFKKQPGPFGTADERPVSNAHGIIDNDLARDNLENGLPLADLQDL